MTARLITENYKSNVSQSPSILSTIYNPNVSLACYCNPANWALSNASKQFSKKQSGNSLQLQGAFDDKMIKAVSNFFSGTSHASLIEKHISLMLDMFISLFEPKEIGLRILTDLPDFVGLFHEAKMVTRMSSSLGGLGDKWVEKEHISYMPLKKREVTPLLNQPKDKYIKQLCDGDIAVYKGKGWVNHENAAAICAPSCDKDGKNKIRIYIDYLS